MIKISIKTYHIMHRNIILNSVLLFSLLLLLPVSRTYSCFAVIVGREASSDGSLLFGHLEQNRGLRNLSYRYVPRIRHEEGSIITLARGGTLTQVNETYAYLWTSNPGVEFGDGYFNEWGVAVASDGCATREDSYAELVGRGDITDGGIGMMLRRIVAQRSRTAREGVDVATGLLDHFGYAASGRTYIIADANEAWLLSVARGKSWIAQRVPDNAVVLLPNVHIIGPEADIDDTENVIASEGLVEYAVDRGWYDPDSGEPFSFRDAFNAPAHEGSFKDIYGVDPRQWFSQSLIKGELAEIPTENQLPFAIYPEKSLGIEDVANIFRSHGHMEGQVPDLSLSYRLGMPENGDSPHQDENRNSGQICSDPSQELVIYQLRNWLPTAIGSVAWRTTAAPCASVLVPWYAGITDVPRPYYKHWPLDKAKDPSFYLDPPPGTFDYDPENAFDVFNGLERMADLDYSSNIELIREKWDSFEEQQFAMQQAVEKAALKLMEQDPELAAEFLTDYSGMRAMKALDIAKEMLNHLKTINWAH